MKILLIGPYPPPHGGVSVHVYEACRHLRLSGIECRVVNVDRRAPHSDDYVSIRGGLHLLFLLNRFARNGWTLHTHTNGHNCKSWLVALLAGLAGRRGPGSLLTLHSGLAPAYIAKGRVGPRLLARSVCLLYRRVIAVSPEVREAVLSLGLPAGRVGVLPAFLFTASSQDESPELQEVAGRWPLLAATLFFRPEYGFELLVEAMDRLRGRHPEIVCLVMGSGERQAQAEQLVGHRNLQNYILFLGNVSHEKCISVMSRCDVFVRPTFADGDANSVREALSLGIRVVASDIVNRPPETVLFRTGDVDDLVAKIEETLSRPRPRSDCDRNAAAMANFKSLLDIYTSLAMGSPPTDSLEGATERPIGKLARLRAMTAREIGFRLGERIMIESERMKARLWPALRPAANYVLNGGLGGLPCVASSCASYLKQVFATKFYRPSADRESVCQFVRAKFPEWIEKASTEADAIFRHNVDLLGYGRVELGTTINWSQDPITGTVWPRRFWADYDPVHELAYGDSKTIHELNRHQHIPRLGKAFYLAGDERYATEAIAQIESWIEQNPEGTGINWQSSLEIAIRVSSWLWTIFFILPSKAFTEDFARRVTRSLLAQLRHVYRYPSEYGSPNTHLIGEAAVLFIAGSLFAGIEEAEKWRDFGADVLTREIGRQVLNDGVHRELSTYYHCYAVDFYLQALTLARRIAFEFSPEVSTNVEQMLEFVMHVTRPDGSIPLLGDDDGGRALALDQTDYRSYLDGICLGALVFVRPDFKRQAGAFREEAFWLFGREAWRDYEALGVAVPSGDSHSFPTAGYFVQRSGWDKNDSHLVFDCGGLGLPTGGHGHADTLSLVLYSGGRELLVDPGTAVYNAAPDWRSYFRSSRAHNTVVVDGQEQSEPAGTFQWKTRAPARVCAHSHLGDLEYVEGEHDGYGRLSSPVSHKRRVLYCRPGYWIVVDELRGSGSHNLDFQYHFAPGLVLDIPDVCSDHSGPLEIIAHAQDGGLLLSLDATSPLRADVICGRDAPVQGWVSSRYGAKQPSQVLCATVECSLPLLAATIIAPLEMNGESLAIPAVRRATVAGSTLSYSIAHGQHLDFLIVPGTDAAAAIEDLKLQGELFWLRTFGGALRQLLGVNVRRIVQEETVLFDEPQPAAHLLARFFEDRIVIQDGTTKDKVHVRDLRDCKVQCG